MNSSEKVTEDRGLSKDASAKSPRFVRGIPRACSYPLCKLDFVPKRVDQRFCSPKCKDTFFKVKYALLTLAPYFNVDLGEGPEGKQ
ncbi:MAG: hypothetical protein ACE5I8_09320 [Thermodesulfobacteriota bacterium]